MYALENKILYEPNKIIKNLVKIVLTIKSFLDRRTHKIVQQAGGLANDLFQIEQFTQKVTCNTPNKKMHNISLGIPFLFRFRPVFKEQSIL